MYANVYARGKIEPGIQAMKRSQIKRIPLSDTTLASLEPETKIYRVSDGNGLYFRVKPTGQKSWELRYKKADGKWSWLGLGTYPSISGAQARKKVRQMQLDASYNNEPIASKKAKKQAKEHEEGNTFEKLTLEWFEARKSGWDNKNAKRILAALYLHVLPVFGHRQYNEIGSMEWMNFFRGMESRGIFEQTSKIRRNCADIYTLARVTGRAMNNPIEGIHRFLTSKPAENYSHVSVEELPELIRAVQGYTGARNIQLGLRLLMITFVRPSELREAPWSEFDFDKKLWFIPAARMKKRREHIVPLSKQALEILKELKTISGEYPLLFPGRNDHTRPLSNTAFNMALRRLGYEGKQTGHGFRHIASTLLREQGFPREHVEAQLAHVEGGVSGIYNKAIYLEQRKEMMQWYADKLNNLANGNIVIGNFARA